MLDPDISTADARRLLSQPDRSRRRRRTQRLDAPQVPAGRRWRDSRRRDARVLRFGPLRTGPPGFGPPRARPATSVRRHTDRAHDGILVNIVLYGGNDGLNTVVPYTNARYYEVRGPSNGNVAIPAGQVLPLDATFGLHPNLTYTKSLWDAGQLAIVHGVGYPEPGPVALHVDGHLDERQIRCRPGHHRLDRPMARRPTSSDRRPDGSDDRFVGATAPARGSPPGGRRPAERRRHVRQRNRRVRPADVQRAPRAVGERRPGVVSGTTCSPAC